MSVKRYTSIIFIMILIFSPVVGAGPNQNTSNVIDDPMKKEAKLYTQSINTLLEDSLTEFAEAFQDFTSGEADIREFADATTQIAEEISTDANEFRDHAKEQALTVQDLVDNYPPFGIPRGDAWGRFVQLVRPYIQSHTGQINALLSQIEQASATVDPTWTPAIDIYNQAKTDLIQATIDLQ